MTIWALADLHLAFGNPEKTMEVFGPAWHRYAEKIETEWRSRVKEGDLVLVAGDISWAKDLETAKIDLAWIDRLPGKKLIIRGNHDYWWPSSKKLSEALPSSIHFIHNDAFEWNGISFGGSRLWDTSEYSFGSFIQMVENPLERKRSKEELLHLGEENEKIFVRELNRLELSLQQIDPKAKTKIALVHYPPIGATLSPSRASALLEKYQIDVCVFGHLHSVREGSLPFGNARGVRYLFTSADYLGFSPIKVL